MQENTVKIGFANNSQCADNPPLCNVDLKTQFVRPLPRQHTEIARTIRAAAIAVSNSLRPSSRCKTMASSVTLG
jgi:hypothetical protein